MSEAGDTPSGWGVAMLAARLFAVDPAGTGLALHAAPGSQRDRWLDAVRRLLPGAPIRKVPAGIADDRLLGGLDLAATLAAGRPIAERGLLADADDGLLLVPSAERMPAALAARIASVHDSREINLERDGLMLLSAARFGLILFDEAAQDDEQPPPALVDRIAFRIDLMVIPLREIGEPDISSEAIMAARELLPQVRASDEAIEALCTAAVALGIDSVRAPLLALRVARIAAAFAGRLEVNEADLACAAQLVLGWRGQAMPSDAPEMEANESQTPEPSQEEAEGDRQPSPLNDRVLDAARAALPPNLLALIKADTARRQAIDASGYSGAQRKMAMRGRRIGIAPGAPRGGRRLDIIATLRAAAPWQRIRQAASGRLAIRTQDFRIKRFAERGETLTIFAVDASGSQALHRMAEAKGAVELLLADCYIRRDQVALIAFRGPGAEILLPPTRALVRAKRSLAGLPAGGGTPLARGIDVAAALAHLAARRGRTPLIVFLTDGRANLARDGTPGRALAQQDVTASALALRRAGLASLLIDTSPRPEPQAAALAETMGATYLALPDLDAGGLSAVIAGTRRHG